MEVKDSIPVFHVFVMYDNVYSQHVIEMVIRKSNSWSLWCGKKILMEALFQVQVPYYPVKVFNHAGHLHLT